MKLLSWMQSKLQGKVKFQNKESHYSFPSNDFDDHNKKAGDEQAEDQSIPSLPLGLLAIGTFGNNNNNNEDQIDDDDFHNIETVEEADEEIGDLKGSDGDNKSNHKSIVKKCVPFLVKKLFVCGSSGFALPPPPPASLTDTPQDARVKKILRMMLQKKIYPRNSSHMASLKRFIKDKERSGKEKWK